MTGPVQRDRWTDGFGVRLGLVLTLALLPVGAMGVFQSADLVTEARARSEAALAGETLRAVRSEFLVIQQAQGAAEALAAGMDPAQPDLCRLRLDRMVAASRHLLFAGVYDTAGRALCASSEAPPSYADTPGLAATLTEAAPLLSTTGSSGTVTALHPRSDEGGRVAGFVAVAPRRLLAVDAAGRLARDRGFHLVIFDSRSQLIQTVGATSDTRLTLPEGRSLDDLRAADVATFTAVSNGRTRRAYSLVRLVEGELYALGSWPVESVGFATFRTLPAMVFPFAMWAVSLVAAWAAAETLVTRHIRRLRTAITAFAGGDRAVKPLAMTKAPREIRETAEAFEAMTVTILHDEAKLEDSLHQKEILLREVHHRVKNNLQLIASIVNMQIRRTKSEEARAIMRSLQDRMLGLATIHNGLYQTTDLSELSVDKLFPGIIEQVVRGTQSRGGVRLVTRIDPLELPLDRAVPLALLLTEALSNAMRYAAAPAGDVPVLTVSFRQDAKGEAVLEVTNTTDLTSADSGTGIGTQLLRGFARQLGGQFHREFTDGMCRVKVWFHLAPRPLAA